jgi:hypothetical protein
VSRQITGTCNYTRERKTPQGKIRYCNAFHGAAIICDGNNRETTGLWTG